MSGSIINTGLLAVAGLVFFYLLYALLFPEKF